MSDTQMTVEVTRIYQGTASELRQKWPEEWAAFHAENPDADDRDWLNDCLDAGGPEVFELRLEMVGGYIKTDMDTSTNRLENPVTPK